MSRRPPAGALLRAPRRAILDALAGEGILFENFITGPSNQLAHAAELEQRRAENPIPPLCDYPPPIHFRWPEYVTTARGEDWWIPAGAR